MARYCGTRSPAPILSVAERWAQKCLLDGGSIFTNHLVWTPENVAHLENYFVNNLDDGGGNFLEKLETQLVKAPNSAKLLCAEMMWVMLLCLSNIGPTSKRSTIGTIASWGGVTVSESTAGLSDEELTGIGSGGTAYNNSRWRELVYFIRIMLLWCKQSGKEKRALLTDVEQFGVWLEQILENESRQFRHMLLFLLFPDFCDRIFSSSQRDKVLLSFSGMTKRELKNLKESEIDSQLLQVRRGLEREYKTDQLDWYMPPLSALWRNTSKEGETSDERIYPILTRFLDQSKTEVLTAKNYPGSHSDLAMRISFSEGNAAHVTWMGFLAEGQSPIRGIYPVYLYYKNDNILVLARGVSATHPPEINWVGDDLQTLNDHFQKRLGKTAIRYGESYIFEVYDLNEPLDEAKVESDLAELLEEYKELVVVDEVRTPKKEYRANTATSNDEAPETIKALTVDEAMQGVFIAKAQVHQILSLLKTKKNVVLQGPPGVGKTFVSKCLAYALMGENADARMAMVQFHQSYSYEDFIQGYRPGDAGFSLKNGLFYQFCGKAAADPSRPYVFIIDEINRGNLSKIFGELMMLIEADKRGPRWQMPLTYSQDLNEQFYVPENVHLIGLMNTADRSLSMVDYALRRRFAFVNLEPEFSSEGFTRHLTELGASEGMISKVIAKMNSLNERIGSDTANLGKGFCIGHSFFCSKPANGTFDDEHFAQVVEFEIVPLLHEYWFDDPKTIESIKAELLA